MLGKFGFRAATLALTAFLLACDNSSTEEKVQGFLESAAEKAEAGETSAAVIELKNALQLAPENAKARRLLGELYLARGQGATAVKELRRAVEYGSAAEDVTANLGRALLLANEPEQVLELIAAPGEDADFAGQSQRTLYGLRAQALFATGEVEAAESLARRTLDGGESFEARLALARALSARGAHRDALEQIDAGLAERPGDPQALFVKANSLVATGGPAAAMDALQTARAQPWRPAMVDLALIELALQGNETELAWGVLDELGTSFENDPRVQYFQALRALSEERYDDARRIAEGLAGQYPEFVPAAYVAGTANVELGNFELGRSYLQTFVRKNPDNRYARVMLARAWEGLGETARAQEVLRPLKSTGEQARERQLAAATVESGNLGLEGEADLETPEGRRAEVQAILQHIQNQEFEAAMAKARELEEAVPESALPVQLQGIILWNQGQREDAIVRMQAALELAPENANAALNLARMHRAAGESESALKVLEPALEAHPENAALLVEAARAHAAANDAERVQALLERALAAEPAAADARTYLARFHLLRGQAQAAVEVAKAGPMDQAPNPSLLEVEGRAQQALGNYEAALVAFEKLREAVPDRPEGYLHVGETLLAMNRPAEAIKPLEEARARSDSPKEAEIYLAQALLQAGEGERAGKLIAGLEEKYPEESDVAILRGNHALSVEQDQAAAVAAFERALELEPSEKRLMNLVQLRTGLGQVEPAMARLEEWRANHEPSVRVDSTLAELKLASGELDAARDLYASLVERAPDNAAFQNNLAWVLGEQGALDQALTHARMAVALAPEDPGVRDTLGVILLKRGEIEEAREHLARAAQAAPDRVDIQVNYGETLVSAGALDKAQAVLVPLASRELPEELRQRVNRLLDRIQ